MDSREQGEREGREEKEEEGTSGKVELSASSSSSYTETELLLHFLGLQLLRACVRESEEEASWSGANECTILVVDDRLSDQLIKLVVQWRGEGA